MISLLKKPFTYLLTGSFSIVFAACYGAPLDLENPKLIKAKDDSNQPIPGLKVTLFENNNPINEQYTNEQGTIELFFEQKVNYDYSAKIEDVDGTNNLGEFNTATVNLNKESLIEHNMQRVKAIK
jgi:hypothetical protein